MAYFPRIANRYLKQYRELGKAFGSAYAVKDAFGLIGQKFNNIASARAFAKRMSLMHNGVTFSIWSGRGFTVSLGIRFKSGRASGRRR